jgi:hypothetical protein
MQYQMWLVRRHKNVATNILNILLHILEIKTIRSKPQIINIGNTAINKLKSNVLMMDSFISYKMT